VALFQTGLIADNRLRINHRHVTVEHTFENQAGRFG